MFYRCRQVNPFRAHDLQGKIALFAVGAVLPVAACGTALHLPEYEDGPCTRMRAFVVVRRAGCEGAVRAMAGDGGSHGGEPCANCERKRFGALGLCRWRD